MGIKIPKNLLVDEYRPCNVYKHFNDCLINSESR